MSGVFEVNDLCSSSSEVVREGYAQSHRKDGEEKAATNAEPKPIL